VDAWSSAHGRVALGKGPIALAGSFEAKKVVASSCARGALALIATDGTGVATWLTVGTPDPSAARAWPVYVDPDGRNAFVSVPHEGRVVVVDLGERIVRGAFPLGNTPGTIAWTFMRAPPEFESDSDSGAR
jgi:DNA-binding beta-propeller fold protein YncE